MEDKDYANNFSITSPNRSCRIFDWIHDLEGYLKHRQIVDTMNLLLAMARNIGFSSSDSFQVYLKEKDTPMGLAFSM